MPRQRVTKTYGRPDRTPAHGNKTFDEIMGERKPSTAQAASTIHRFGKTSFTSKRNAPPPVTEEPNRKRKASEEEDDDDAGFGDPFSFDSDDDGPSQPKRGMGYKVPAERAQPAAKAPYGGARSQLEKKQQNAEKKSAFDRLMDVDPAGGTANNGKSEPGGFNNVAGKSSSSSTTRTYGGRGGKSGLAMKNSGTGTIFKSRVADNKKQLSMDAFTSKAGARPLLTYGSRARSGLPPTTGQTQGAPKVRKFFTSRDGGVDGGGGVEDHNYSQNSIDFDDHTYSSSQEQRNAKLEGSSDEVNHCGADTDSGKDITVKAPDVGRAPNTKPAAPAAGKEDEDRQTADQLFDRAIADGHIKVSQESQAAASSEDNDNMEDSSSVCSAESSTGSGPSQRTFGHRKKSPVKQGGLRDSARARLGKKSDSWAGTSKKILGSLEKEPKKKREEPVVRRLLTSPKKRDVRAKGKAVYNPRQWHDSDEDASPTTQENKSQGGSGGGGGSAFDADFDDEPVKVGALPVMKRSSTWPAKTEESVSKLHVTREHKPLFTVVRNVKQAHECQEYGETQEFQDDVEYIMEGLDSNKISIRCLSTVNLATKCTVPGFRMHLRAHGLLLKIFSALHDAAKYPNLALCTAAVMYMMSRDRIGMDIEKSTLELMLSLLSVDSQQELLENDRNEEREYEQMKNKLQGICDKLDKEGNVKHFVLEEVSTGHMAMETLLSLTSRKAGDWFKEELRVLGGLDHIINTVIDCVDDLEEIMVEPLQSQLDCLRKIDRCLRVLENVTYLNSDNQQHLVNYKSSALIRATFNVMKICEDTLPFNEVEETSEKKVDKECPGYVVFSALLSVLRILLNLTHDHAQGCAKVGQKDGMIRCVLNCILRVPKYVMSDQRFDMLVLGLGLLINMVEHCETNRRAVLASKTNKPYEMHNPLSSLVDTLDALTMLFNLRYKAARQIEEEHDREMEERERKKAVEKSEAITKPDPNQSGWWRESESGLEWVMIPLEEREHQEEAVTRRGKDGAVTSKANLSLDSDEDVDIIPSAQDENDEKFTEALHKAGKHMEDNIVGAYVALLVGCLVDDNRELGVRVRDNLPDDSFEPMVRMLKKFLGFMNFTSATGDRKSIIKVIQSLENF